MILQSDFLKPSRLEKLVQRDSIHDIDTQLKLPRFNPQKPAVEELRECPSGSSSKVLDRSGLSERLEHELGIIHRWALMIILDLGPSSFRTESRLLWEWDVGLLSSLVAYALGITGIDPGGRTSSLSAFKCGALHHAGY